MAHKMSHFYESGIRTCNICAHFLIAGGCILFSIREKLKHCVCLFISPAIEWQQKQGLNYIAKKKKWSEMGEDEYMHSQTSTIISFKKKKNFLQSKTEILQTNAYKINENVSPEHKVYDYWEFKQK